MLKIYTDAAYDPKSKKAGIGLVYVGDQIYEQMALPLDIPNLDNHMAEMAAIIKGLELAIENGWADQLTFLFSDSQIAVKVFERHYTKNPNYQTFIDEYEALEDQFAFLSIDWHSERKNHGADRLARQGLQKALKM